MSDQSDEPLNTSYRFTDSSLVRPAITRFWFARLFPLIPEWLAANVVTLLPIGDAIHPNSMKLASSSHCSINAYFSAGPLRRSQPIVSSRAEATPEIQAGKPKKLGRM